MPEETEFPYRIGQFVYGKSARTATYTPLGKRIVRFVPRSTIVAVIMQPTGTRYRLRTVTTPSFELIVRADTVRLAKNQRAEGG